ncbi:hypothetical protein EYF80_016709 [Liparis tanakae]|uniref:Uncharacterized protein n=1 Tax=Liparis tanakae TaxID=230148 RepID=A0A4Z2I4P7_9TELE|nr:hypothetical protein EYF80_016709 [Liparis tanakae]
MSVNVRVEAASPLGTERGNLERSGRHSRSTCRSFLRQTSRQECGAEMLQISPQCWRHTSAPPSPPPPYAKLHKRPVEASAVAPAAHHSLGRSLVVSYARMTSD